MVQAVKIGGAIVFSMREKYYNECGHKQVLEKIIADGKINFLKSYSWIKYEGMENERSYGVFHPDAASVLVFKKIKN